MPLTSAEFDFMSAYVGEVFSQTASGPHTTALHTLGIYQKDLNPLWEPYCAEARKRGITPFSKVTTQEFPVPWANQLAYRNRLRELEQGGMAIEPREGMTLPFQQ